MSKKHYTPSRNGGSGAKITAIIALFLSLIVGAYVVLSLVFKSWNPVKWTETKQDQTDGTNDGNVEDKDPSDDKLVNSGENKGILLRSARIASEQYEDYGIDAQANTAYSITATVNEDAADKSVIGSVSLKNASSTWATGKNINDYVTLNQTTEYGLNFTLTVKQAFGEPIMIKVASCMDSGIYGTAQVDHLKELKSFKAVLNPSYGTDIGRINVGDNMNTVQITPSFGVGTIEGTISNYKTTFTTNAYFRTELKSKLNAGNGTDSYSPAQKIITTGKDFKINWSGTQGSVAGVGGHSDVVGGLMYGGGNSGGAYTIVNNFVVQRGATNAGSSASVTAGVVQIKYEITYSYGNEYSVVKTWNDQKGYSDNPTELIYAFRNDNLTMISTIDNIQVAPDNIVVLPVNAVMSMPALTNKQAV